VAYTESTVNKGSQPSHFRVKEERVLFIDLGSHYGGVETYLDGLAGILGPSIEGYALSSLPRLTSQLRAHGMTVFSLPLLGSKWFKGLRFGLACFIVPYLLLRFRIRKVQLNGYFESLLLAPLRAMGCETIYTMHGPFETDLYSWFRNPARFFPRFLSRQSLRFASHVVCVSETVGEIARKTLPPARVRVIANWVQPPLAFRNDFSVGERPRLLFVGRLEEYKGVQFILRAIEQVGNVSLTIVGDGPYRAKLEQEARQMDVHFAGFQADPSRFYPDSTVFINPSLGPEGLPLVSLEAMAYGLPCIFSDLPVHREISAEGEAAALFTRGNSESLAEQLRLLLKHEGHRRRYGNAARQLVEQHYSRSVAGQQYIHAFGL
jgi:glycosyltransferase involved in cell wall biosynthesis